MLDVFNDIREELETPVDDTSQELIIAYLEVLLNYSNRYYKRQFITRKAINMPIIERFEQALNNYYPDGLALEFTQKPYRLKHTATHPCKIGRGS